MTDSTTDTERPALNAGTYVVGYWRGVLRHKGYPWYRCPHEHGDPRDARDCARKAKAATERGKRPEGWFTWHQGDE